MTDKNRILIVAVEMILPGKKRKFFLFNFWKKNCRPAIFSFVIPISF